MPGVVKDHFGTRVIAFESFSAWRQKERVVLSPHRKDWRPLCAEEFLKPGVQRNVARIIQKQVELNLVIAWTSKQCRIELISLGRYQPLVLYAVQVLPPGCCWLEKLA